MNSIAFLHIGKNAGTQIVYISNQLRPHGLDIIKYPHNVTLKEIPNNQNYFFSIRNPIDRFKSGFYSRKRKGRPRLNIEWSAYEHKSFNTFEHANDLAESLFEPGELGAVASSAITAIGHISKHQIDWFAGIGFLELRPPVWIIRQEHLKEDYASFLARLGLEKLTQYIVPAENPAIAHINDYTGVPIFSMKAIQNLRSWYARDFVFYENCIKFIQDNKK